MFSIFCRFPPAGIETEALTLVRVINENIVKYERLRRDKKRITARYTADNFDKVFTIASRPSPHPYPMVVAQAMLQLSVGAVRH